MNSIASGEPTIAVFDFDDTLVASDSMWPFLVAMAGWPRTFFSLIVALLRYAVKRPGNIRTFVKDHLIRDLLKGYEVDDLIPAIELLQSWQKPIEATMEALRDHHARGHHIVIASGGLDLYLPALLENVPHDALICTTIEVKDGIVTGRMVAGNCVRERKAELVAAYIEQHGPFMSSWGYGNLPHDLPMLNLMKHRVIV